MKKYLIVIISIIILIILYTNSFRIFMLFSKQNTHVINLYNMTGISIDSISVKACITCEDFPLKEFQSDKIEVDISKYKSQGKDNFFFINIYQGNYYLSTTFNYHDNWGVISKESSIYVYDNFLSQIKIDSTNKHTIENEYGKTPITK